jgi:Clr5 domain
MNRQSPFANLGMTITAISAANNRAHTPKASNKATAARQMPQCFHFPACSTLFATEHPVPSVPSSFHTFLLFSTVQRFRFGDLALGQPSYTTILALFSFCALGAPLAPSELIWSRDIAMDPLGTSNASKMPAGLSFEQKWDFLKPHIERLYIHEKRKLAEAMKVLQTQYTFDAT